MGFVDVGATTQDDGIGMVLLAAAVVAALVTVIAMACVVVRVGSRASLDPSSQRRVSRWTVLLPAVPLVMQAPVAVLQWWGGTISAPALVGSVVVALAALGVAIVVIRAERAASVWCIVLAAVCVAVVGAGATLAAPVVVMFCGSLLLAAYYSRNLAHDL